MITRIFTITGALFALLGVITRALSSHALRPLLAELGKLENFNLASDYSLIHGLATIIIAIFCQLFPNAKFPLAGWAFLIGSFLFQGTVFLKCFIPLGQIGILTPIGGAFLMAGWILLIFSALRITQTTR
jgi:uncharacterized membrane protein YgdD (TMEM256/DUF423 family)